MPTAFSECPDTRIPAAAADAVATQYTPLRVIGKERKKTKKAVRRLQTSYRLPINTHTTEIHQLHARMLQCARLCVRVRERE